MMEKLTDRGLEALVQVSTRLARLGRWVVDELRDGWAEDRDWALAMWRAATFVPPPLTERRDPDDPRRAMTKDRQVHLELEKCRQRAVIERNLDSWLEDPEPYVPGRRTGRLVEIDVEKFRRGVITPEEIAGAEEAERPTVTVQSGRWVKDGPHDRWQEPAEVEPAETVFVFGTKCVVVRYPHVQTRYQDGATVTARVNYDAGAFTMARDLGYRSIDTWRMCVDHEIGHHWLAHGDFWSLGSPTMWRLAHPDRVHPSMASDDDVANEEAEVLAFQRTLDKTTTARPWDVCRVDEIPW